MSRETHRSAVLDNGTHHTNTGSNNDPNSQGAHQPVVPARENNAACVTDAVIEAPPAERIVAGVSGTAAAGRPWCPPPEPASHRPDP